MHSNRLLIRCIQHYIQPYSCCNKLYSGQQLSNCCAQRRVLHTSFICSAGHSHYENIRHIKSAKDNARSKVFSMLSKKLEIAIREGGSNDPKRNLELAQVLKLCKKESMPRQTIERALNGTVDTEEYVFSVQGPGGSSVVVTCHASSLSVAKLGITYALKRSRMNGKINPQSLEGFTKKRMIVTDIGNRTEVNEDAATEIALSVDAEEVELINDETGTLLELTCDATKFRETEKAIEQDEESMTILSSGFDYVPKMLVDLSDSDRTEIELFFAGLKKASLKEEIKFELSGVSHNINNIETFDFGLS